MNTTQLIPTVIDKLVASGVLTSNETNPTDADTVKIGAITYRFKTTMAAAYDVKLHASDADITLANLVAAINGTGTAGTEYFAGTEAHPLVTAGAVTAHASTVTAQSIGYAANSIATTVPVGTTLSWGATTLVGGVGGSLNGVSINGDANGDTVYSDPIDMAYYDEAIAFLNVTAHAGTNPTLDVSFEFSPDGVTWMASGDAFAQVTTSDAMILKRFTANFGKWVRAKLITAGTSPAYTLALYILAKGK
jgi:hypothetical protein